MPAHVRKGDEIVVTSGFQKGQSGIVLRVMPKDERVLVRGVNVKTKHVKPSQKNPQGGIISREEPIHISKVSPRGEDGRPSRVRFETKPDGSKVRVAARGGKVLGVVHGPREGGDSKPAASGPAVTKKTAKK